MKRFYRVCDVILQDGKVVCPADSIVFEDGAVWTCIGEDYYYYSMVCNEILRQFEDKPYTFGMLKMKDTDACSLVTLQDLARQEGLI